LRMNRAFRELAKACSTGTELASIFGPSVLDLLAEADANGRASAYLPVLAASASGRTFRILLKSSAPGESISALVMDVSEEVAWRRQLFDRSHDFRVLNAIGAALSGTQEQDVLALRILEQTRRIIPITHFQIALLDPAGSAFTFPVYVEDGAMRRVPPHPLGKGFIEHVLHTRRPLLLS